MKLKPPKFQLLPLDLPRAHERRDTTRCAQIAALMSSAYVCDFAIIVGEVSVDGRRELIVVDGHHRLAVAREFLRAKRIPALMIDYRDDRICSVKAWREGESVTKADVISAALTGELMPIKTSRHCFGFEQRPVNVPLSALR